MKEKSWGCSSCWPARPSPGQVSFVYKVSHIHCCCWHFCHGAGIVQTNKMINFLPESLQLQTLPFRRLLWYFFFFMLLDLLAMLVMLERVSVVDLVVVGTMQEVGQLVEDLEVCSVLAECEMWEMTGLRRGMAGGSEGGG